MSRKILVTFGDSCTYGDGLEDCLPPQMENPSKFAWPTLLASKMDYDVVNLSKPGASNKEISHKVLSTKLPDNAVVIVGWSFYNRTCIIKKHSVEQIGIWQDSKASKSFFRHLHDDYDMHMDFYLRANHIKNYLDNLGIENHHWRLEETLEEQIPFWNSVKFLDFDYHKIKKKYPMALDNLHPGPEAHKRLAEKFEEIITRTRSSVG
tara:strand:+ start:2208 stop:2828 length:621 start_codon:yes stop_codon:yes gene_type:complete